MGREEKEERKRERKGNIYIYKIYAKNYSNANKTNKQTNKKAAPVFT